MTTTLSHPVPAADIQDRAREIANGLTGNEGPRVIADMCAALCEVSPHCVLLTYAYDHPADGGAFGVRAEVTLHRIMYGRGRNRLPKRVHGDGATAAEMLVELARAVDAAGKAKDSP